MKKILFACILALLPFFVFASPFGLRMGMSVDEIAEQCEEGPVLVEKDIYLITPKKSHPQFDYYAVCINENVGLYAIMAMSTSITTNKYGSELQDFFIKMKNRISKSYGKPLVKDEIRKDVSSIEKKDEYWFYTLKEGERELSAKWESNSSLTDDLDFITLKCTTVSGVYEGEGRLLLGYRFTNADRVEDEQDSVF